MITRFVLMLAGLFAVGLVGAFLLYVSVLSIVTAIAVLIGLVAALVLGYWAGSNSLDQPPPSAQNLQSVSVMNAAGDVTFLPQIPNTNMKLKIGTRMHIVSSGRGQQEGLQRAVLDR
jgi:hypothetical protein